jgi:collagenase-like PrtC family protease
MNPERLALTVGPVLTYWSRKSLLDFYAGIAESAADTVVLGEVVCSRRHELNFDDWLALAADLRAAGKEVILGTQVLVESEADLRLVRRIAERTDFLVEAGDASALNLLNLAGRPFVIGPHINIYSRAALEQHARLGAVRWVAPVELPLDHVGRVNPPADRVRSSADAAPALATEVPAFGRMPLAFSARCFTARHHRLSKDQCEFRCRDDADGLLLSTTDGRPFLVLNGIQTQSAAQHCLIDARTRIVAAGITRLRLLPCAERFDKVVACFERVMNQGAPAGEALVELQGLSLPGGLANGYSFGRAGMEWSTT